jgi:hypothetical protein
MIKSIKAVPAEEVHNKSESFWLQYQNISMHESTRP